MNINRAKCGYWLGLSLGVLIYPFIKYIGGFSDTLTLIISLIFGISFLILTIVFLLGAWEKKQ